MAINKETWVVDKTMAVLLRVSRLYGIVPVRFQSTRSTTVGYISRPIYYCGILFLSLINFTLIADLFMLVAYMNNNNPKLMLEIMNISIIACTAWHGGRKSIFKMKRYFHCATEINKIINSLKYISRPSQRHVSCLCIIAIFDMAILPLIAFWDCIECTTSFTLTAIIGKYILYGCLGMMIIHFVFVSLLIDSSFVVINKGLADVQSQINRECKNEFLVSKKSKVDEYVPGTANSKLLSFLRNLYKGDNLVAELIMTPRIKLGQKTRELSRCFVQTCTVLRELNDTEDVFLLSHIVVAILLFVTTVNNIAIYTSSTGIHSKKRVTVECIWLLCHILRTILIVEPCHRIQEEYSQTKMLVAQIMCEVTGEADPLEDATDNFLKQLLLNEVSFSVMGICTLGRSIIPTVVGVAATLYVMILEF